MLCCCQTIVTTCWHSHELYVLSTPRNVVSRVKACPGPKDNEASRGKRGRQTERERENCLAYRIAHTRINTISEVLSKMQRQFSIKLHIIGIPFVSSSSGPEQTKSGRLVEEFADAATVHCEKATPVLKGSSTR